MCVKCVLKIGGKNGVRRMGGGREREREGGGGDKFFFCKITMWYVTKKKCITDLKSFEKRAADIAKRWG